MGIREDLQNIGRMLEALHAMDINQERGSEGEASYHFILHLHWVHVVFEGSLHKEQEKRCGAIVRIEIS